MGFAEKVKKVEVAIYAILGVVSPVAEAIPLIQSLLGKVPAPIAQEFPPERIDAMVAGYIDRDDALAEKFLPPSDESGVVENGDGGGEDEDGDDGTDA